MKKKFASLIVLLLPFLLHAQEPSFFRTKGSNIHSTGASFTKEASNKLYTAGLFHGTVGFDPGPGTFKLSSVTSTGYFALKLPVSLPCTPPTFLNDASIVLDASECGNDGNISIIPTSGTAPFQFSLNGGATYISGPSSGYTFKGLAAATYQLRLKDANGCESAVASRAVKTMYPCSQPCTPPTFLNDQTIVLDASCGKSDGSISIIPTSGKPPFQYSIDGGLTYVPGPDKGFTFMNLSPGFYLLKLKDASGCESASDPEPVASTVNASLNGKGSGVRRQIRAVFQCPASFDPNNEVQIFVIIKLYYDVSTRQVWGADMTVYAIGGEPPYYFSIDDGKTYIGSAENSADYQGFPPGIYQFKAHDSQGRTSETLTVTIPQLLPANYALGVSPHDKIEANDSDKPFRIYPNPTTGQFYLDLPIPTNGAKPPVLITVLNSQGMVILQKRVAASKSSPVIIDLAGKAKGVYIVSVLSEKGMQNTKVVVQ